MRYTPLQRIFSFLPFVAKPENFSKDPDSSKSRGNAKECAYEYILWEVAR